MKKYGRGTDSVPALLSPHEAVLNRRAADLLGRDKIKKLNAKGNAMARYQRGTSDVYSPEHEDQGESMMRAGVMFTPQELDTMQKMREAQNEVRRKQAMNEKPAQYQSGTSDVKDLIRDIDNKVDEGGQPPQPTPTPTPTPRRKYQYGTANVAPYNQNQPAINYTAGAPTGGANLNVTSNSTGFTSPFGNPVPYLPAGQSVPSGLNIGNLIYSASAGGYLTRAEAENANSWYNKFGAGGGGDPMANRQASAFYNWIGNLPTRAAGTPALNQLYGMTGYTPQPGPSYNSILGNIFNNASPQNQNQFRQAGFGPTYTGPYAFGQRTNHGISGTGSPMSGTAW